MAEDKLYKAEYVGSGTFIISKPKRKKNKQRQSDLKNVSRADRASSRGVPPGSAFCRRDRLQANRQNRALNHPRGAKASCKRCAQNQGIHR